jgi:YggT family protein
LSAPATLVYYLLQFFLLLLIFRLIMEYVFMFARSYRPTGIVLILLEAAYTITDPPLKLLRRFLPPLRLGGFALDLGFIVLFFLIAILSSVVRSL